MQSLHTNRDHTSFASDSHHQDFLQLPPPPLNRPPAQLTDQQQQAFSTSPQRALPAPLSQRFRQMSGRVDVDSLLRSVTCYRNVARVRTDVVACISQVGE